MAEVSLRTEFGRCEIINITCYDKDGKVIKQVTSSDPGNVDDEGGTDNPGGGGLDENPLG